MARINIPPLTRSLIITLVAFTLLNAIIQPQYTALSPFTRTGHGAPYISVVPGVSFKYPWTFVTASFVEQNVFGLLVTGLTLFYGGRYLERAWSSSEFAKFILFVGVIPNVLCFILYVSLYALSGSERALYVAPILTNLQHKV
jgi:membrane associated rhomboid family serine protease